MKIKSIIFDWGGVIAPSDSILASEYLSEKYSIDQEELLRELDNEEEYSINNNYSSYLQNISSKFNIPESEIIYAKNLTKPGKVLNFCQKLSKSGYNLYLLSDQMKFRADYIKKHYDLSLFQKVFFSNEIGYTKSSPEAFKIVLNEESIEPKEWLFIDDSSENINLAKKLGLKTILFENYKQLLNKFSMY